MVLTFPREPEQNPGFSQLLNLDQVWKGFLSWSKSTQDAWRGESIEKPEQNRSFPALFLVFRHLDRNFRLASDRKLTFTDVGHKVLRTKVYLNIIMNGWHASKVHLRFRLTAKSVVAEPEHWNWPEICVSTRPKICKKPKKAGKEDEPFKHCPKDTENVSYVVGVVVENSTFSR